LIKKSQQKGAQGTTLRRDHLRVKRVHDPSASEREGKENVIINRFVEKRRKREKGEQEKRGREENGGKELPIVRPF